MDTIVLPVVVSLIKLVAPTRSENLLVAQTLMHSNPTFWQTAIAFILELALLTLLCFVVRPLYAKALMQIERRL